MLINAIGQLAAAFLATIAFSVLFHVPKKQYFVCGLTGTLGWLVYLIVNLRFSKYSCLFCGNGGYCVLCTVVCGVEKSTVECVYDLRNFSNRAWNRHLQYDL